MHRIFSIRESLTAFILPGILGVILTYDHLHAYLIVFGVSWQLGCTGLQIPKKTERKYET